MWNERINARLDKLHARVNQATDDWKLRKNLANWHEDMIKHIDEIRPKRRLSWNQRRLINSFAKMKFDDAERFENLKQDLIKRGLLK